MPTFTLRPATLEDNEVLLDIAERMVDNGIPPWRDREQALDWHRNEALNILEMIHPGGQVIVAESPEGILGFISFYAEDDFMTGEEQGYVADLAVTREAEGQGVGSALLAAAEDWCRECGFRILALDVFAMNTAAREFYQRRGFQEQTIKMVKVLREGSWDGNSERDDSLPF